MPTATKKRLKKLIFFVAKICGKMVKQRLVGRQLFTIFVYEKPIYHVVEYTERALRASYYYVCPACIAEVF